MSRKFKSVFGRRTNFRKARFEALENRRLLTVTVKVANNDIFISGDGANNGVAVFEDAIRRLFIYGDTATAIAGDGTVAGPIPDTNAGGGREFDPGQYTNIFISMGSGNDLVQIAGLQNTDVGQLDIKTGDATGGDNVSIGQSTFAGSPDIFFGFNAVTKGVSITGGNGNDVISVNALTTPSLSVSGGALPDVINVATSDNVIVNGNASVNLDDGGGTVNVGQNGHTLVVDGNMNVNGGSGNDFFTLDGLTVGNVSGNLGINTGLGNDQVTLGSNSAVKVANGNLTADLGDSTTGNILTIGANASVTVSGDVSVRNGAGNTLANAINVDNLTAVNLSLTGGNADDKISLAGVHGDAISGNVSINSGNAGVTGDQVSVGSSGFAANINGSLAIVVGNVTGNVNNQITVDNSSAGSVSITAGNGTQKVLVGSLAAVTATNGMAIKTGTGNDTVDVDNLTGSSLAINTDIGDDTIDIAQNSTVSIHGNLSVAAGDGDNTVAIGQHSASIDVDGNVSVVTGSGDDSVTLNNILVGFVSGNLSIQTGDGDDTITLGSAAAVQVPHGSLTIDTGDATTGNTINIGSVAAVIVGGKVSITAGSGNDIIIAKQLSGTAVAVDTGAGSDQVTLDFITSNGFITVDLGEGTNSLALTHSKGTAVTVTGGSSADTINFDNDTFTNLTVDAGDGANVIHLNNSTISQATSITTGTGIDQVSLSSVHANGLAINTGASNDTVTMAGAIIDHLQVKLAAGADTFTASNSTFTGLSTIAGGVGKNKIKLTNVKHTKTILGGF